MRGDTNYVFLLAALLPAGYCLSRPKRNTVAVSVPITDGEKMEILKIHNDLRRLSGSSDMRYMSWDSELAWIAEQYSKKCQFKHNPSRKHTKIHSVGENIYATSARIPVSDSVKAVTAWYEEVSDFNFDSRTCTPGKMCGHYTQVVWATSYKVGCAMTVCDHITDVNWRGGGTLFICNYGPSGNVVYNGKLLPIFGKGIGCSKCDDGDYCRDHLCANSARDFIDEPATEGDDGKTDTEPEGGGGMTGFITAIIILAIIVVLLIARIVYRERVMLSLKLGIFGKPVSNATRFSNQNTPVASRLNTPRHSIAGSNLHGMQRLTAADILHPIEKLKTEEKVHSASAPTTPRRGYVKGTSTPPRVPPPVPPPPLAKR